MPSDADLLTWLTSLRVKTVAAQNAVSPTSTAFQSLKAVLAQIDAEMVLVKPAPPGPPAAPAKVTLAQVGMGVAVTFTAVAGALGYDVFRGTVQIAWPALLNIGASPLKINADGTLTYLDTGGVNVAGPGLAVGSYSYTVRAYTSLTGAFSAPQSITVTLGPPPPPPPPVTLGVGLPGIYAYDQTRATTDSLRAQLALPVPTAANPLLVVLHLRHDADGGWPAAENVWFGSDWSPSGPAYRKIITVPGWPDNSGGTLAAMARGDLNGHYETITKNLAATFPGEELWIRFIHEANCCYEWHADVDPVAYKGGWAQFAPIARRNIPGVKLIFCPYVGMGKVAIAQIEPDPALFDGYGPDAYGRNDWKNLPTMPDGLVSIFERAKTLGKFTGIFEWGPGRWTGDNASVSMTDDPAFTAMTYNLAAKYGAHVVAYCDDTSGTGGPYSYLPGWPNNLAMWQHTFGTATPHQAPVPV